MNCEFYLWPQTQEQKYGQPAAWSSTSAGWLAPKPEPLSSPSVKCEPGPSSGAGPWCADTKPVKEESIKVEGEGPVATFKQEINPRTDSVSLPTKGKSILENGRMQIILGLEGTK